MSKHIAIAKSNEKHRFLDFEVQDGYGLHEMRFMLSSSAHQLLLEWVSSSKRIALIPLKIILFKISIILVCAPTRGAADDQIEVFYIELE